MQSTIDTTIVHHKAVADLIKHRNTSKLKTALRSYSYEAVIMFIGELYKGNGWIVSYHWNAGKPDSILLSYPKSPLNIMLIVRVEDSTGELSFKEGRAHLLHFENELASQYHCTQFCLICLSGFEELAQKLENFNLLLQDWSYVEDLMKHYNAGNKREPRIQLFAHNKLTYKKAQRAFSNTNTVAVVQATGTGKSFLIARLLHDYAGENRLILAPSRYILEQLREHIRWDNHIKFMTYTRAMYLTEQEIRSMKLNFIVLDEFHRCGAEEWGRGVQNILNVHPKALVFGTTATPVRYLDNNRDMAAELFNGTIAENINLAQAIVRSILPMPKYITALYTLKEEADKIRNRITNSVKSSDEKKRITLELDTFEIEWENSFGVPEMLRKNIGEGMKKFIVFCKEEEHLNEMEALVKGWFNKAFPGKTIKTFRVLNAEKDSDKNFKEFKTFHVTDEIHLLFSINMLNEGLHVNEVNGVILLRPTASPTIFYQQIGRCLKVGMNNTPLIFDLVNNFNNIRSNDFLYDLQMERSHFLKERNESGLSDRCPVFTVIDETRKISELFGKISFQIDTWNEMYERLTHFYKNNGHTRVTPANCTDSNLFSWVTSQRQRYKEGYQSAGQIAKLNQLQFEWSVFETEWEKTFEMLVSFKNETGHCRVPPKEKKWSRLASWMTYQRKAYREFNLPAEKVKRLESVGFSWYPVSEQYDKMFAELKSWFLEHGHTRVNQLKNQKLASFVSSRKYDLKAGRLSKEKIEQLNALDPKWSVDYTEDDWNNWLLKMIEYKEKFGHCDVSVLDKVYGRLGEWVTGQRMKRRKGMLSDRQIETLESVGIRWEPRESQWDEMYHELKKFYELNGHSNVRQKTGKDALANFVTHCRAARRTNNLSVERLKLLEEIEFPWDGLHFRWEKRFEELVKFKNEFGTCYVPSNFKTNKKLGSWTKLQIENYHKGTLSQEYYQRLLQLGFDFEEKEKRKTIFKYQQDEDGTQKIISRYTVKTNDEHLKLLAAFQQQHGHCNVTDTGEFKSLNNWLIGQRKKYKENKLSPQLIEKLEQLGFDWNPNDAYWIQMFDLLKQFKKNHGHCDVTSRNSDNRNFVAWIIYLRRRRKNNTLSADKIAALDSLGFVWSAPNNLVNQWNSKLNALIKYKEKHGDFHSRPTSDPKEKTTANLIGTLRYNYKRNKLPESRIEQLKQIGFVFDLDKQRGEKWQMMFEQLQQYKAEFGHCRVPEYWKKNVSLALFVAAQRKYYKDSRLTADRVDKLNKLGFEWNPMNKK